MIICKYKFDSSIYNNLIPEFNSGYTGYTVSDEINGNIVTRTIECNTLPTLMRFGQLWIDEATDNKNTNRCNSLLEILEMNTSALTNMSHMFRLCKRVTSIECDWNTSNATNMVCMFENCYQLTSLDVSNFDTTNVTAMSVMFCNCNQLTSLDVSNFDTKNITNMSWMFGGCKNLTSLDLSNFDTKNVTNMRSMFNSCSNLTSLDVSNFDTKNVTNMRCMFEGSSNLTSLDVSNFDTSNVNTMQSMFSNCTNLTQLDVSNFNTSNVTDMYCMFNNCTNLTQLDVSNFNTSKVASMQSMFNSCTKLAQLDVSNFDTSNVNDMSYMFSNCTNLTQLDVSNFDTNKVIYMGYMFNNTSKLVNIGMLYCSPSTINTISSNLSNPTTVWINGNIIKSELTSYDNITYEIYYYEKELLLNSPLLEGDKIVKKDGKIYHYHKMGMIVLNGSESWSIPTTSSGQVDTNWETETHTAFRTSALINPKDVVWGGQQTCICDKFKASVLNNTTYSLSDECIGQNRTRLDVKISKSKLSSQDTEGFKVWLQANPVTVVYELATPYYELISEDKDLSLTLPSADNILTNNSLIPTNMNIKNNSMSTVGISNSSTYTVVFDKDTDNNIVVNLNGTSIETSDNRVEITTSNELRENELTFIGEGEISNVRILDGSVSGDNIPRESFEGLKSSFEDGYIPSEEDNLAITKTIDEETITSWYESTTKLCPLSKIKPNIDYTLIYNLEILSTNSTAYTDMDLTTGITSASGNSQYFSCKNGLNIIKFKYGEKPFNEGHEYIFIRPLRRNTTPVEGEYVTYRTSYIYLFEGDWTHLTVEDFNHLGQYKVEYKVTGKNKININKVDVNSTGLNITVEGDTVSAPFSAVYQDFRYYVPVKRNTNYYFTIKSKQDVGILAYYGKVSVGHEADVYIDNVRENQVIKVNSGDYDFFTLRLSSETIHSGTIICNQLMVRESVDDSYEPYKEYTKTFYLNSPLLEGDTIEDINGVATHVKRYGKVVLDGSSDEIWGNSSLNSITSNTTRFYFNFNSSNRVYPQARILTQDEESIVLTDSVFSDNFRIASANITAGDSDTVVGRLISLMDNASELRFVIPTSELSTRDLDGFRQWLSNNPTTVVYELLTPQYETISNESILCDSYVNGHLDFDSATPVEKVDFRYMFSTTKYSIPSTKYIVQFESDDAGKLDMLHYAGTTFRDLEVIKGLNTFSITSSSSSTGSNAYFSMRGIGFNASNIQVVATARDNIKYFKGMESSFEDKVIRNKNLFNKNNVMFNNVINETGEIIYNTSYCRTEFIECKPNTPYTCNVGTGINYFDENKTWLGYQNHSTLSPSNAKYLIKCINHVNADLDIVQIEEGIESTTYEEYNIYNGKYEVKITLEDENGVISNESIYLNSPLLKGDRIEMYNGKLCHYHKMGKIVLDGSEDEEWKGDSGVDSLHTWRFYPLPDSKFQSFMKSIPYSLVYSDNLPYAEYKALYENEMKGISVSINGNINIRNAISSTVQEFKAWLQANPTTVVYELAEPYYEEITPEHNEFTIVSIGESSFTIDSGNVSADGEVTYNVNVKLLNDLEENMNSNTSSTNVDLTTILDDIINE